MAGAKERAGSKGLEALHQGGCCYTRDCRFATDARSRSQEYGLQLELTHNEMIMFGLLQAILLSKSTLPTMPDRDFRAVVWSMYQVFLSSSDLSDETIASLLRVSRACVYFEAQADPEGKLREQNWLNFQEDKDPAMSLELMEWSQSKYAELGATRVLVKLCGHPNQAVRIAALRFGTALLAGSNLHSQQLLLDEVLAQDSAFVFECFHTTIEDAAQAINQLVRKKQSGAKGAQNALASIRATRRSSRAMEPELLALPMSCQEAVLVMTFLSACMCNQNLQFKQLMLAQPGNSSNYNLLEASGYLLSEVVPLCSWSESQIPKGALKLLCCVIELIIKAVQGPCPESQVLPSIVISSLDLAPFVCKDLVNH